MSDHIFDSVFINFGIFAFGYEMLSAVVRSMIWVEFKFVPNTIEYFAIPIVCQLGILAAAIFICIIEKIFAPKLLSFFVENVIYQLLDEWNSSNSEK